MSCTRISERLSKALIGSVFCLALALAATGFRPVAAQEPVDYVSRIQPLFEQNCAGGFCHVGQSASGVRLDGHDEVMASVGLQYGAAVVVPFRSEDSPLIDKVSSALPRFGDRMPLGGPFLDPVEIALLARWIDEGATLSPATRDAVRGDYDDNGILDLTDAINSLRYMFIGDIEPPRCHPVLDSNADGTEDVSDPIYVLTHLFMGGDRPVALSEEENTICNGVNLPPRADPIGTVLGREGVLMEFRIRVTDPNRDRLIFTAESVPDGLEISPFGRVRWTPRIGQAGDHRIRVRIEDRGEPPLSTFTTALLRIAEGNHPPSFDPISTAFGREGVGVSVLCTARDIDGDGLRYTLLSGPAGSSLEETTGRFEWTPDVGQAGEYEIRVGVTDDAELPASSEIEFTLIIASADSPVNQPPRIPPRGVYRTYPGRTVALPIEASDPDGDAIRYEAVELPDGARLDETTGIFRWVPRDDQLGPFYVIYTVTDSGLPPETIEGLLVLKVSPEDSCVTLDCDPERGCDASARPLEESCCSEPRRERVAEPLADCPEGRIVFIGRNVGGFGRMQNCDQLRVIPFAQGGLNVRIHIETRCLNPDLPASVFARLETVDEVLFERRRESQFKRRVDGYAQRLDLIFGVDSGDFFGVEGKEARLYVQVTDIDGVVAETTLRVRLTRNRLEDLPEPDVQDVPAGEVGCVGCHRPLGPTGERHGIEEPHPWYSLTCTDCHGGNALGITRASAHVTGEPERSFLKNMTLDELNEVPRDYVRFVNPGDLRVADVGCGAGNPANPGSGCHQGLVESVPMSVMATYAGHYMLPRYLAGAQDRSPRYAAVDITDPNFIPADGLQGLVESFEALREPDPLADRSDLGTCMDIYLPKGCPTCHLSDFGPNDSPGNFRSSGCTACHMLYAEDGLSRSDDPVVPRDFPPHPEKHRLTSAIPTEQCAHCHFQGGRIGLSYRGIREGGFDAAHTPENGVTLGRDLHAHDPGYYFVDEDATNDVDETPPDLHATAGMVCVDCHVGGDVHGGGKLYASAKYQLGIICEDCHGTVRSEVLEDPDDGLFKNSGGFPLKRIRRAEDDRLLLKLAMSDRELQIPQIHRLLESGVNVAMTEAMGVNEHGFSHTDKLECYTCHTSWRQTCFGCHVTIDDGGTGSNRTTGEVSQGALSVTRDMYATDFFALGVNRRGKISPLCSSMSVFVTYIDAEGVTRYRDRARTSFEGRVGFGWNPFHHHTVSRVPQNCDRCHPVAPDVGDNTQTLRETYGFGRGEYLITDGDGVVHDTGAFLDEAGELMAEFPHPGTGPVPSDVRQRALSIEVVPHPRQDED